MKIRVKAVVIKNEWKLNRKYRGIRGWIRRHRKGKLEKAHGVRMTFGEKEVIIDLSYMAPQMLKGAYVFLPPIPINSKDDLEIDMIPKDADLYPYDIDVITAPGDKDTGTPGVV